MLKRVRQIKTYDTNMNTNMIQYDHKCDTKTNAKVVVVVVYCLKYKVHNYT